MAADAAPPTVVALLADLFFAPRFADVIAAQGGKPLLVESPEAFVDAVDGAFPVLALVDLGAAGDWASAIQRCKMRPHTRQVPIYAFGSHVETETLRAARKAGADHAWARSRMLEELPALIAAHVAPPVRYPEGWDAPLSDAARHGIEEFNRGDYFEQHEHLEHAWMAEKRPVREMYQGILQVGVALLQIERSNWAGAIKMFRRGLPRLRDLPPVCQGVDVAAFRSAAESIHAEITALGPEGLATFDRTAFPHIIIDEGWHASEARTQE
jgi:CheY-like chemotaxis protein